MANPEHLQILKQGVETWNAWRKQHEDIIRPTSAGPSSAGQLLFYADLSEANLAKACLYETVFQRY